MREIQQYMFDSGGYVLSWTELEIRIDSLDADGDLDKFHGWFGWGEMQMWPLGRDAQHAPMFVRSWGNVSTNPGKPSPNRREVKQLWKLFVVFVSSLTQREVPHWVGPDPIWVGPPWVRALLLDLPLGAPDHSLECDLHSPDVRIRRWTSEGS